MQRERSGQCGGVQIAPYNASVSKPTFENPAGLGKKIKDRRAYEVDDTVEF